MLFSPLQSKHGGKTNCFAFQLHLFNTSLKYDLTP